MGSGGQDYYFHTDALGSIVNLTDSSGQTEWTYRYDPYGSAKQQTKNDPAAPDNPLRYSGQLLDPTSGLYNLRARNYDPTTGQFLTPDPAPATQTTPAATTYLYAAANPTVNTDPSGLHPGFSNPTTPSGYNPLQRLYDLLNSSCVPPASVIPNLPAGLVQAWIWGWETACMNGKKLLMPRAEHQPIQCKAKSKWQLAGAGLLFGSGVILFGTGYGIEGIEALDLFTGSAGGVPSVGANLKAIGVVLGLGGIGLCEPATG